MQVTSPAIKEAYRSRYCICSRVKIISVYLLFIFRFFSFDLFLKHLMLLKLLEMLNNDLTVEFMSLCLDRLDRWNRFIHFYHFPIDPSNRMITLLFNWLNLRNPIELFTRPWMYNNRNEMFIFSTLRSLSSTVLLDRTIIDRLWGNRKIEAEFSEECSHATWCKIDSDNWISFCFLTYFACFSRKSIMII